MFCLSVLLMELVNCVCVCAGMRMPPPPPGLLPVRVPMMRPPMRPPPAAGFIPPPPSGRPPAPASIHYPSQDPSRMGSVPKPSEEAPAKSSEWSWQRRLALGIRCRSSWELWLFMWTTRDVASLLWKLLELISSSHHTGLPSDYPAHHSRLIHVRSHHWAAMLPPRALSMRLCVSWSLLGFLHPIVWEQNVREVSGAVFYWSNVVSVNQWQCFVNQWQCFVNDWQCLEGRLASLLTCKGSSVKQVKQARHIVIVGRATWRQKIPQLHLLNLTLKFVRDLLLCHCWLDVRKSIGPVKTERWGTVVAICLQQGANDLRMVQLMPLPPHHLLLQQNPEWFFSFLVLAYPDSRGKKDVKWM